jgi:hypothetical protein
MTSCFTTVEKIISIILIIWGGLSLYVSIQSTYYLFDIGFKSGKITWQSISVFKVFKNYHLPFLLPVATTFAGIFLFVNKKIGWTTALITLLLNGLLFLIPTEKGKTIFDIQDQFFYLQ